METNQAPAPVGRKRGGVMTFFVRLVVTVAVLGGGWAGWHYYGADSGKQSPRNRFFRAGPQTVRDAVAKLGDMPITLDALGTVTPLATVTVKSQVSGSLQSVAFSESQMVKAGDEIARIDSRPYEATLAQQKATLAKDTATLNQAETDLSRYEALARQDSIATQQVADQGFLVEQDKATLASDQAQIAATQLNIGYTHIIAPISGLTGLRQVDVGNYVTPGDAGGIVVITQMQPMSVMFSVPENSIAPIVAALRRSGPLDVTLHDRANVHEIAKGKLETFNNQVDTATGTLKMRATFDNLSDELFPNQFVNVTVLVDTLKNVVLVPVQAVQIGSDGSFVYVIGDDGTVKVTPVVAGPGDGTNTAISSGLQAGQHVVIDGTDQLRDGVQVAVAGAAPRAPAADGGKAGGPGATQGGPGNRPGAAVGQGAGNGNWKKKHEVQEPGAAQAAPAPAATPGSATGSGGQP